MPDMRRLTSKDLAHRAGVSQTTVSLVLRGVADGRVSAETQEHVRAVARELGYQPSLSARSLRSGRAHMLGLVIPDVLDPFFGAVLRGAQEGASERGYTVAMIESTSDAILADAVAATQAARLDGIVIHSPSRSEVRRARAVADQLVVLDGGRPRGVSWIGYDVVEGLRLIFERLEALGHRRIGHVGAAVDKITFGERAQEVARVAGDRLVASVSVPFDFDTGRAVLERFLAQQRGKLSALVCDADALAAATVGAARRLGIAVPEELSVIAFNDTPLAHALELTTVDLPAAEAGRVGVRMLLERNDGGGRSTRTLPVTLVERASTACAPARRRR